MYANVSRSDDKCLEVRAKEMVYNHKAATILAIVAATLLIAFVTNGSFREGIKWSNPSIKNTFAHSLYKVLIPILVCTALFFITLITLYHVGKETPENLKRRIEDITRKLIAIQLQKAEQLKKQLLPVVTLHGEKLKEASKKSEEARQKITQLRGIVERYRERAKEVDGENFDFVRNIEGCIELHKETEDLVADGRAFGEVADEIEALPEQFEEAQKEQQENVDRQFAPRLESLQLQLIALENHVEAQRCKYQQCLDALSSAPS